MATEWDNDEELDGPPALRKAYEKLQKQQEDTLKQLEQYRTKAREGTVKEILTARQVNPKIAKFIPSDVEDAESVESWLTDNADVFGFSLDSGSKDPAPEPSQQTAPEGASAPQGAANNYSALTQMADAETGAVPVEAANDWIAKIAGAGSPEELQQIVATVPNVTTSRSMN